VLQERPISGWWLTRWLRHGSGASQSGDREGERIEEKWQEKKAGQRWFCLKFGFSFLHA
jgi:hypothetical protein